MGAVIEDRLSKQVTHVLAMDSHSLLLELDCHRLSRFKGVRFFLFLLASIFLCNLYVAETIVSMAMKKKRC